MSDQYGDPHLTTKANRALPGPVNYAQIPQLAEHGLARARQFLLDLDAWLESREFIAPQQFSVADITAVVTVDFARIIKIRPDERHPHLLSWPRPRFEEVVRDLNQTKV